MKAVLFLALAAPLLWNAPDEPTAAATAAPQEVTWLTDLDLATSIAAERDRPLMIVFR